MSDLELSWSRRRRTLAEIDRAKRAWARGLLDPDHPTAAAMRPIRASRLIPTTGEPTPASQEKAVATGTVKWFDAAKGYGFIRPEDGSRDVFVHISAVERSGMDALREGQKVHYEVRQDPRNSAKSSAENLRPA